MIENRQEVFFIGHNVGFLSIRGKTVYKPIYFQGANIKIADFRDVNFASEESAAYFVNTVFQETSFENAEFHGQALFTSSCFKQTGQPSGHFFNSAEHNIISEAKFFGIVQFENAVFYHDADFRKSEFHAEKPNKVWNNVSIYGELLPRNLKIKDNYGTERG